MSNIAKSHESTQSKPDSGRAFPLPPRKSNSFGDELAGENFEEFSEDSVREEKRSSVAMWPHHKLLSDIYEREPASTHGFAFKGNNYLKDPYSYARHTVAAPGSGRNRTPSISGTEADGIHRRSRLSSNKTMDNNESIVSNSYFKQYARNNDNKKLSHGTENSLVIKPNINIAKSMDSPADTLKDEDGLKLKNSEGDNSSSDENRSRQEEMISRLKQIMGGEDGKAMGWGVFVKEAARARISSAFQNALDHVVFDATKQELEIIADKTYFDAQTKIGRRKSIKRKKQEAPKLKKILERHGIISKKNLEKKKLKKVLNNLVRRKSKINYMKEWVQSLRRGLKFKIFFTSFINETMILHPKGRFRLIWDMISVLLIFYDLFYVPFTIGFATNATGFLYVFDILKDIFFFVDLILNFITAFYDKNGNLIRVPKVIVKHYLSTKLFYFDLITALPIPLVADLIIHQDDSRVGFLRLLRFLRFLRLIRVLKAVKLLRIYHKVEEFFYSSLFNGIRSIFSLLFYIILCAHWIACLWHFVGQENENTEGISWLSTYYNLKVDTLQERYVASLYFAIMTMITVGYGDITPVTMSERIVSIVAMLSGCAMFAYSMNSIGILVQNINARASKTRQLYYSVNKYMEDKNVSKPLRNKIMQYLDYMAETQKQDKNAEEAVFAALSGALQDDLKKDINGRVLRDSLLFTSTFGSTFRASLSYYLEHQTFSPGQIIFDEQDKAQSLYFLAAGTVEFLVSKTNVVLANQEKDSHFGEYAFFTGKERTAAARSMNFTSVFHIKKEIFLKVIEEFPYEKEMFHMIKDKINLYEDFDKLKTKCFICKQEGHYAKYCFRVHHVPDRAKILADYFANESGFMKHHKRRSKKKKFHALAGKKLLAMRVRDLIIDHPQEMKKYIQSDLYKSNSFIPSFEDKNHLNVRVVGERRRSRTLTNMVVLSPQHLMGMESVLQDEDSVERTAFVEKHKNKVIMKLITSSPGTQNNMPPSEDGPNFQIEKLSQESSMTESDSGSSHDVNAPVHTKHTLGPNLATKRTLGTNINKKGTLGAKLQTKRTIGTAAAKLYIQAKTNAEKISLTHFDHVAEEPEADVPKPTLQRTSTMRKIIEHEYEHFAIDMVTNYQVYFPHNNSKRIIDMINQPYKYKKRDARAAPDSGRKKPVEFNRSNTETIKKMKSTSASPDKRGKSVFVKSRYSIWTAAKNTLTLKRKPTGAQQVSQAVGILATKNQALAGLIPNVIKLSGGNKTPTSEKTSETPYARRMSKSLGNLDAPPTPVSMDPSPTFKPPRFLPQHTFEVEDSHDIQSSDLRFVKDSQENVDRSMHYAHQESGFKRSNTLSQKKIVKRGITLSPIMARRDRDDSWRQHSPADSQNDRFF